jgi:hypothetical protein
MSEKSQGRGVSIVGPFILIGLGIVLLLQQLNVIQWSLWEVAFRLWPLIIIAVGADILIARRSFLGAVASLLVVLALLGGGIYLMGTGWSAKGDKLTTEEISYDLGDAAAGDINLSMDAGKMDIAGLMEDSKKVVEGTIRQSPSEEITASHNSSGSRVSVVIQSNWPRTSIFRTGEGYTWDLGFSRRIPLDIDLSLGVGEIVADLTKLQVTSVNVRIGAGQLVLYLQLPEGSDMKVNVSIGAGSAEIHLQGNAEVKVVCTTGVGNCALPNSSGFWGQTYTSTNYSTSKHNTEIEVSVGVGEAEVIR